MAGHSQFKNIMHRKGAQDRKRAQEFSRVGREITVATRIGGGGDPASNARLRTAVNNARAINMPRDNIERAIQKGLGSADGSAMEEIRYEGYGPEGVAVIVETVTDNRNRSSSNVRSTFARHGGNLGTSGSVIFQFSRQGHVAVAIEPDLTDDALMEIAITLNVNEFERQPDQGTVTFFTEPDQLGELYERVQEQLGGTPTSNLVWQPASTIKLSGAKAASVLRLIQALDELDDVQSVVSNITIPDDELAGVLASL